MAEQALVLNDIAPGRFRLGIGPKSSPYHRRHLWVAAEKTITHIYVNTWRFCVPYYGKEANYHGEFFNVEVTSPEYPADSNIDFGPWERRPSSWPGEIADGALSWLCLFHIYSVQDCRHYGKGEAITGRLSSSSINSTCTSSTYHRLPLRMVAGHQLLDFYTMIFPFYVKMFTSAGFPTTVGGAALDGLVESLVISGDEDMVTSRFSELLSSGLDELVVILSPIIDAGDELFQLLHSIGGLKS